MLPYKEFTYMKHFKTFRKIIGVILMWLVVCSMTAAHISPPKDTAATKDPMSKETFNGLKLRSIGPALTSGRISSIAVDQNDGSIWYIGAASGGVWKTTNAGTTWSPIFENEGSYSIGCISLDPNNPLDRKSTRLNSSHGYI